MRKIKIKKVETPVGTFVCFYGRGNTPTIPEAALDKVVDHATKEIERAGLRQIRAEEDVEDILLHGR